MITWFMRLDWHNPRPGTPKYVLTLLLRTRQHKLQEDYLMLYFIPK